MDVSDAELAIIAAESGAAVVREKYGTSLARVEKSPLDFATDADILAEQAIMTVLRAARPDDALVGEESGASQSGSPERCWLVDPLCGTLNYAAQTPLAAVNVALRSGDKITAAACADPFTGEVMWTSGGGAHLRRESRPEETLRPSPRTMLVDLNLDGPFPNADRFRTAYIVTEPAFAESFRPRVCSTTLALAWVAAGRRAAYVTDGHLLGSVHFASGIALCQAAGCIVTGLQGQPLHTGVGGLIAAADERTHSALLAIAGKQFMQAVGN